jgi:putative ABC transport system permease protein
MGARPANLIGQLLIENLILAIVGWLISLALSLLVFRAVTASDWLGETQFILNTRVVLVALLFALVFGVLSGLIPAWRTARMNPALALKGAR